MANKSSVRDTINFVTFPGSGMIITPQTSDSPANWSGPSVPGTEVALGDLLLGPGWQQQWGCPLAMGGGVIPHRSSPPGLSTPSGTAPLMCRLLCSAHVAAPQSQLLPCPDIPLPTFWLSVSSRLPLWITESQSPLGSRRNNPFSGVLEFYICISGMQTPITEN